MARRSARAAAVQMVYENLLGGDGGDETLTGLIEFEPEEDDLKFIREIVDGVTENAEKIDEEIKQYLTGWTIDRIARVDLSILRVAVFEIENEQDDTPDSVICNEAVTLAQRFSTENSGRFVNGVLGAFVRARQNNA